MSSLTSKSRCLGVPLRQPLITSAYTADPSAHVFNGKLYIYPSHDLDHDAVSNDEGDQYAMQDYHVYSIEGEALDQVVDHGEVLHLRDVPWAQQQLWAPDAVCFDGQYLLVFPARDRQGIFRIGVARGDSPAGPFRPDPVPVAGTFSIDPAVFVDDDGQPYLFFGGLWGGQLEKWETGTFDPAGREPEGASPALGPRVARLSRDMRRIEGQAQSVVICDPSGHPLRAGDHERRFFEGVWVHKHQGLYYLSYSTGDTHLLVYATSSSPFGPYQYRGRLLNPVIGWTTHHSIVEFCGRWYLFYHDASLSGGIDHKRCVKVVEFERHPDGSLPTLDP